MSDKSSIEWTESTWNPVTGCSKISDGCKNCYAERMANRLQAMGNENYKNGFKLTLQPGMLDKPLSWKKPRKIFVNSMSDLFHEDVPLEYIQKVFSVMKRCPQHTFQVLTKRSLNLRDQSIYLQWPKNVWMGVSIEDQAHVVRTHNLRTVPAKVRFLSIEPLLGPIENLDLTSIDWVIVGGESGPNSRPMKREWVIEIKNRCDLEGVPFFFKQWGGVNKKKNGRLLGGQTWDAMPDLK